MINSYNQCQERKKQEYMLQLCDGITILDSAIFTFLHNLSGMMPGASDTEMLHVSDFFPDLFAECGADGKKTEADEPQGKLSPEMQVYKAKRLDHAYRFNAQRAERS